MNAEFPMAYYYSIFQRLFKFIHRYCFDKMADQTFGNRRCKHFSAWRQFFTGKDSLFKIASGLVTNQCLLYLPVQFNDNTSCILLSVTCFGTRQNT